MGMSDWSSVYSRIIWKNKRAGGTALNATNLNTGDIALKEIDDRILVLRDSKFNSDSASGLVKDWKIDTSTGVITVTWYNNTTQVYDLNIEKIPVSFSMSENGVITMVTEDGTEFTADIKSVVPIYSFVGSETVSITPTTGTNGEKVFTFSVVEGSIEDKYIRPDYLADIKVSESNASQSETNAKTYAEQAKASAESIGIATTTNVGTVKPDGTTISVDTDGTIHVVSSGSPSASAVTYDNTTSGLESDDVQSAIDELDGAIATLGESVSSGKTLVANAITEKGVATSGTDSFSTMADNIADIKGGAEITIDGEPYEGEALALVGKTLNKNIEISTLPYAFKEGCAVTYDNEIHILGGNKSSETEAVKHYKWNGTEWVNVSTLPYRFGCGCAVVFDNEIHILGGIIQGIGYLSYHYKWNGTEWVSVSTLPYECGCGCAVVYNNEIHLMGGYDNTRNHYKWNGTEWVSVSSLPFNFYVGSAVVLDNKIHILGGGGSTTNHYMWNGSSWSWVSSLPYDFYGGSAVAFGSEIVAIGTYYSGNYGRYVIRWNGTSWSYLNNLDYYFNYGSAVVFNQQTHILGGGPNSDTEIKHYTIYGKWFMMS